MATNNHTINRLLAGTAHFLSSVLSPFLTPTYGVFLVLWISVLCLLPNGTRITVLAVILGITCILPMIIASVLHHFGLIKNHRFEKRQERLVPYLFCTACYIAAACYLYRVHAPQWFVMFMGGTALAALVDMLINLKWKISAHMTGLGGLVALIYQLHVQGLSAFELFWVLCATIILAGLLGTARLILNRHSMLQVIAGFVVGYACITLMMTCFG